jgi:hypothetical protein
MIDQVITYLNTQIESADLYTRFYGLCEKITKDGKMFPAEFRYGQYNQVSDFDKGGTVYHRLIGDVDVNESDEENPVGCDPFHEKTYPMRLVAVVKKRNTAYTDINLSNDLSNTIVFSNNKTLRTALSADNVSVEVTGISTDREKIFKEEYEGMEMFFDYEYSIIAIDYNIKITGNVSCFQINGCDVC